MQVSLLVVDDMHGVMPHAEKDIYFGESPPEFLPYTKSSINSLRQPYMGSTANLRSVTRTVLYNYWLTLISTLLFVNC